MQSLQWLILLFNFQIDICTLKSWNLQFKIAVHFECPNFECLNIPVQIKKSNFASRGTEKLLTSMFKFCRFIVYKYMYILHLKYDQKHVLHDQYHTIILTVYDMTATMALVPSG